MGRHFALSLILIFLLFFLPWLWGEPTRAVQEEPPAGDTEPTAAVMFDKEISAWQINLTLPSFPVFPEDWPRIKSATEDMLALWEEVRGELSDDGQWWSEAKAQ